uniref:Uncharacterized protein n=1 Tax=Schistosoma curassoni TaxID=6186 RepID=A0A183JS35_9TREM
MGHHRVYHLSCNYFGDNDLLQQVLLTPNKSPHFNDYVR